MKRPTRAACLLSTVALTLFRVTPGPEATRSEESGPSAPRDPRVILRPGRWKILRPGDSQTFLSYQFYLNSNLTFFVPSDYPECAKVSCQGLPDDGERLGCDVLCGSGSWRDADVALSTSVRSQYRTARELQAAFKDLEALADAHLGSDLDSGSQPSATVDVMGYHRSLIEEARAAAKATEEKFQKKREGDYENDDDSQLSGSAFAARMNAWRSGALLLSAQLNAVTFALVGARERLAVCAQGLMRADMTGCAPGSPSEFHTDVPTAARPILSRSTHGGLALDVERKKWEPVLLSRWYMAFVDSSSGNRTCWLDRGMVNDSRSSYREPRCDRRGLCDSLRVDGDTLSACQVKRGSDISQDCPLVCGSACFGPLCYDSHFNSYTLTKGVEAESWRGRSREILVAGEPQTLSGAHLARGEDERATVLEMRARANAALDLLNRGVSVTRAVETLNATFKGYAKRLESKADERSLRQRQCEKAAVRGTAAASVALFLSTVTCPVLVLVIVKMKC
uniref:Uncharacterized protein n=1 Tax=Oryzias latipes TaxID=8090 RepID=A0A286P9W6_ORYLA|nr:hypothetical protein [Oryzias latipes]